MIFVNQSIILTDLYKDLTIDKTFLSVNKELKLPPIPLLLGKETKDRPSNVLNFI